MPAPVEQQRRLFFALWPDDVVRQQIAALSRQVCKHPVPEGNLHLTLRFIGKQDEATRRCFSEATGQVKGETFTLSLDCYGGWSHKHIQWSGPSAPPQALGQLVDALNNALAACGMEVEKRPFIPHVTLSRKTKNPFTGSMPENIRWSVRDFVLAESVSLSNGVRYVVLERWTL